MRLIDADELKKELKDMDFVLLNHNVEDWIDEQPTVDEEPVRHGNMTLEDAQNLYLLELITVRAQMAQLIKPEQYFQAVDFIDSLRKQLPEPPEGE